ncbi:MAG: hypothetical protein L0K41_04750 [Yaniella sp.]|uniref:hypothetical protein n=2 Tax=Yaniella sp. TaxID=2773929 RepID=UPI002649E670|nr:hypothetical protein [Yaniella sp.]MDN5732146.1 hypothetical protein [Yaniella sp.]MDN5816843.1 hypothetical protein [Yaniella sp.]MDN5838334.1 hypothetical protein [Yaniella sp.]MDN5888340.1 hypothetical protein [Yaniella sp.]MDN5912524.1 hypothetical protein [Yaniella sp.]
MSWMDQNPYSTGSRTYQRVLVAGMIILGIGFIAAIVGGVTSTRQLSIVAAVIIGTGLVTHVVAQIIRMTGRRRELRENLEADNKRRQQRGKD